MLDLQTCHAHGKEEVYNTLAVEEPLVLFIIAAFNDKSFSRYLLVN